MNRASLHYIDNLDTNIKQNNTNAYTDKQTNNKANTTTGVESDIHKNRDCQQQECITTYESEPQLFTTWNTDDLWPI